jgi:uncharacterized protein (TIGR02271 family)
MSHTVVGLFNDTDKARHAIDRLIDDGFEESNIDMSAGAAGTTDATSDRREHENGIEKFFRNLFGDNDDADRYTRAGRSNTVVTVHTTSDYEAKRAADLLDDFGAIGIDEADTDPAYTNDNYRATSDATTTDRRDTDTTRKIPVVEENLEVGKREVETGGVRVRSRIVEKPVEENLRLRQERVTVERTPVDRTATPGDLNTFEDKEIELTERKEVPVVNKEARVTEEITVNKEAEVRNETVRDTLKKTEVDVENLGSRTTTTDDGNL